MRNVIVATIQMVFTRVSKLPFSAFRILLALTPLGVSPDYALAGVRETSAIFAKGLQVENVDMPLGVDSRHPRLRWKLDSTQRGQLQTAYQVQVASSSERLRAGKPDKWDSGKVLSDNSIEVRYAGEELFSSEKLYWRVRVWGRQNQPSDYSEIAPFDMGLLDASDWGGEWIQSDSGVSAPIFRREIAIPQRVRSARAYVSGLGWYEMYINGNKVGDRVLDPASTYYNNDQPFELNSRVLYATFDVTNYLKRGQNSIGIMLGNGWFSSDPTGAASRIPNLPVPYGDRPRFIIQINIELNNGQIVRVFSDRSWRTSSSAITSNDIVDGEVYDARLEVPGWNAPGFDDSGWPLATVAPRPNGALRSQLLPAESVIETLPAVKVITPREPEFFDAARIFDFGQNFTGWVRLHVSGSRGARIVLRYGTKLFHEDDTLDNRSNTPPLGVAWQTDTYVLKGTGIEVWEPRFTLHGFRFVEIVPSDGDDVKVQKVEGRVVQSSLKTTGSFSSSNELLNRIHSNIKWTFMSSLHGMPQDAAERLERVAWLGDAGFVAEDFLYNFDMLGFWEKWLDDIQDSQKASGDISVVSPLHWRFGYLMWPCWKSTYPEIVWLLYEHYGSKSALEKHYGSLKRLLSFIRTAATDNIIEVGLGDHMEPQTNGTSSHDSLRTPQSLTSTAYYYYDIVLLERMARVLGYSDDAEFYGQWALEVKASFNRRFLNHSDSQYAGGSQASNSLALYLNLVPDDSVSAVLANLVEDIKAKSNYHVSTGIIGSNSIVQVLPKFGQSSLMYLLANQTSYPSLGYQVKLGATTICETYECSPWTSQNMKMFGSLDKFFYRNLAGIQLDSAAYQSVMIRPEPMGDLLSVSASLDTVRGAVSVDWRRSATSFDIRVLIPAGMRAVVLLPTRQFRSPQVTEGNRFVWKSGTYVGGVEGVVSAQLRSDLVEVRVGSGHFHFRVDEEVDGQIRHR